MGVDITRLAGKGPMKHLHCTNRTFRAEYDRIFGKEISTWSAVDLARGSTRETPGPRGVNRADPGTESGTRRPDKP